MMEAAIFLLLPATLAALVGVAVYAMRTGQLMRHLEQMLEDAIQGRFTETQDDESRVSRLEAMLGRFLSASVLSRSQLEADRQALKETIGDISHQTKTPIANMLLYTQLLQEQELSPEVRDLAVQINMQGEKLDQLIQALVKVSRLETGVIALSPEQSEVIPLLEELERSYAPSAQAKGIILYVPGDAAFSACFDPKWTAEALGNILDNAIKYTPPGGQVSVSCQKYELFCRIDVSDTGPGIPEEEQANIFQRFYRGRQVRQADGVGIGLYLSRQIIAGEGGYVKVQSTPGRGSTFSVFLPV